MKILSLSLDPQILNPQSVVALRNRRYGSAVEKYTIVVPCAQFKNVPLSENTTVIGTGGKFKAVQFFFMLIRAARLLSRENYDVVTSQDTYFLGLVGVILSRVYECGLEIQVLGIEKLTLLRKILSWFTLKRAHSIRVLSDRLKERLMREFGISEEAMVLVPIYVDVSTLGFSTPLESDKEAELQTHTSHYIHTYGSRFNIASVNRLVPIKNIPMQLQAIAALKDEFPAILLHIIGEGPEKETLQKDIDTLGIAAHVILHGPKFGVELSPFFTHSDCFILTSDFEGYGMVIVEAATAGMPIVMTDVGCAGEVVVHETSGLIVPPKDTAAFITALRSVIQNPDLRDRLKAGAQQSIAQLPTFDMVLEKYIASWHKAAARLVQK